MVKKVFGKKICEALFKHSVVSASAKTLMPASNGPNFPNVDDSVNVFFEAGYSG